MFQKRYFTKRTVLFLTFCNILILFIENSEQTDCSSLRFPKFFGSSSGYSTFNAFDVDSDYNIALSGQSQDPDLITDSSKLTSFVAYLPYDSVQYKWAFELNVYNQTTYTISFRPDGSTIALLYQVPFTLLIIDSSNGDILGQAYDPNSIFGYAQIIIDDSNYIYMGVADTTIGYLQTFIYLDLINYSSQTSWSGIYIKYSTGFYIATLGSTTGEIFFGAESSNIEDSDDRFQATIIKVQFSSGKPTFKWVYSNSQGTSNMFGIDILEYYSTADNDYLFGSATNLSGTSSILLIILELNENSSPTDIMMYKYYESTDYISSLDIEAISESSMALLATNLYQGNVFLVEISVLSSTQVQYTRTLITTSSYIGMYTQAAKFTSESSFYFGGYIYQINDCTSYYSNPVGFITVQDSSQSCISLGTTSDSSVTDDQLTTYFQFTTTFTKVDNSYTFSRNTIEQLSDITSISQNSIQCCFEIETVTMDDATYSIGSSTKTLTFEGFTLTTTCSDSFKFTYSALVSYTSGTDLNLPSYISFDNTDTTFDIYTIDQNTLDDYYITITGTLPTSYTFDISFSVTFQDEGLYIISKTINDMSYIVGDNEISQTFSKFKCSDSSYTINYYLYNSDESSYDDSLFSFTNGGTSTTISVYSIENSKVGTYNLKIIAYLLEDSSVYASSTFKLTVIDKCINTSLKPSTISDQEYVVKSNSQSPMIFQFEKWKNSKGNCGTIAYAATLSNGTSLPSFIAFQSPQRQFTVTKTSDIEYGTYQIKIFGILVQQNKQETYTFTLTIICEVQSLTMNSQQNLNDQIYIISSFGQIYFVYQFKQVPSCNENIKYSSTLINGGALPGWIDFEMATEAFDMLKDVDAAYMIYTEETEVEPFYDIELKAVVKQPKRPEISGTFQWRLRTSTTASDQQKDPIQCTVRVFTKKSLDVSFLFKQQSLALDQDPSTKDFIKFDQDDEGETFNISPTSYSQIGQYFITISYNHTIKDSQILVLQPFIINIVDENGELIIQNKTDTANITTNTTNYTGATNGSNILNDDTSYNIKAKIKQISQTGLVDVLFTQNMVKIMNLTALDNTVLNIRIIQEYEDLFQINFTWEVIYFEGKYMKIQLNFEDPLLVSQYSTWDKLSIQFTQSQFFISKSDDNQNKRNLQSKMSAITPNYSIQKAIPRQMTCKIFTGSKLLQIADTLKNIITSLLVSNFGINLAMYVKNIKQCYIIQEIIIKTLENDKCIIIIDFNAFDKPSYKSLNAIRNLGGVFTYLMILVIIEVIVYLVCLLFKLLRMQNIITLKNYRQLKFLDMIKAKLYHSSMIKLFLSGGIKLCICAFINIYKVCSLQNQTFSLQLNFKNLAEAMSTLFSIALVISFIYLAIIASILGNIKFQQKQNFTHISFNALYENLQTNHQYSLYYNAFYLARRIFLTFVLIFFSSEPILIMFLMINYSLLQIIYLILVKPFEQEFLNKLEIFNESCILIASYHLIVFSDAYDGAKMKFNVGWCLVSLALLQVLINLLILLSQTLASLIKKVRDFLKKRKMKKNANLLTSQQTSDQLTRVNNFVYYNNSYKQNDEDKSQHISIYQDNSNDILDDSRQISPNQKYIQQKSASSRSKSVFINLQQQENLNVFRDISQQYPPKMEGLQEKIRKSKSRRKTKGRLDDFQHDQLKDKQNAQLSKDQQQHSIVTNQLSQSNSDLLILDIDQEIVYRQNWLSEIHKTLSKKNY